MKWTIADEIPGEKLEQLLNGKVTSIQDSYEKILADGLSTLTFNVNITLKGSNQMEIIEMLESVHLADSSVKGYKFHCAGVPNKCQECGQKLMDFVTLNIEEAFQHSKRNSVAMWFSKD